MAGVDWKGKGLAAIPLLGPSAPRFVASIMFIPSPNGASPFKRSRKKGSNIFSNKKDVK
jgi:hypothetical protein